MSRWSMLVLAVALGCGNPVTPPVIEPKARVFTPDAVADGAALFTRAALTGSELEVSVVARKLGPVLGYAFRLEVEGGTAGAATVEEALGPNAFGEAIYFSKQTSVGAARQGAAAGEKTLDDETVLSKVKVTVGDAPVRLKLVDTSVRRANGAGVAVALAGGELGGAR